jgi:HD superfamily phosphohydrolase/tRNA A-37 threonylcarbamoyl transferase component Bud32
LLDSLRQLYSEPKENEDKAELQGELVQLERILPQIAAELAGKYELDVAIDRGGAGVVLRVVDLNLSELLDTPDHKVYRALKVARPIEDRQKLLNSLILKELKTLAALTHSNVIKLYYANSIIDGDLARAFYVMDFVEGAITPTKFLSRPQATVQDLLNVLRDIISGMAFLFSQNVAHNDLKPSNVLVGQGRAIISDLGSAVKLTNSDEETTITFTRTYAHPDKLRFASLSTDSNRLRRTLCTKEIKISWDLYSLGLTILELLDQFASSHDPNAIAAYDYRYLRLLGSRLLDGYSPERFRPYAFPKSFYDETRYGDISGVITDLAKLTGEYRIEREIPELDFFSGESIQVAQHGQTPVSDNVLTLIRHPAFKRLSSISQLGLIVFVYPGATHSRAEHSLGAYGNAARILYALWHDPINPMFRQIMTKADLIAGLLAALLHDLGQYPLAHDLEDADDRLFAHEPIGFKLASQSVSGGESLYSLTDKLWPSSPGERRMSVRVEDILRADVDELTTPIRDRILHSVIDGPIDADKLDYLVRDSRKLNVPYGLAIDFERLSKVLTTIHEERDEMLSACVGVHEKGKVSAESVAFVRYAMFGAVYWHRTSRAVKAMLHHAVWDMLQDFSEAARRELKEELIALLVTNALPEVQRELFEGAASEEMKRAAWPGINVSDLQMLSWLYQRASAKGRRLIEDLANRNLYKRVLVVSKEKRKDLWQKAKKCASGASPKERIALSGRLQEKLVLHLQGLSSEQRKETAAFNDESVDTVHRIEKDYPLVLLDIPGERTEGMSTLRFFGETDRWRYHSDELVKIKVEESVVWSGIVDSFGESLGKIRVFVHPAISDIVRAIDQTKLESLLSTALPSGK